MKYEELMSIPPEEQKEILLGLSQEDVDNLWDQKPYPDTELTDEEGRKYFDDLAALHEYAREHLVPATKPYEADAIVSHEGAHSECALALGAVSVRYYVLDKMHETTRNNVFVEWYNPEPLPNLAWAAISMHPFTASQSLTDMGNIRSYGYRTREQVRERIVRWNERESGIYIPELQKEPKVYL